MNKLHYHWSLDFVKSLLLDCEAYKGVLVNNRLGMYRVCLYRPELLRNGWTWVRRSTILGIDEIF